MASPFHSKQTGNDAIHPATYVASSDPASPDTSVTADGKLWIDTTTGTTFATGWLLKIRASSNTVWTTILDLATTLALKANLASPTFTGVPAAPTAAPGTNTTQIATTAFVAAAAAVAYTDEQAQDAVGTILATSSTVSLTYADGTPSITGAIVSSAPLPGSPTTTTQSPGDNSTKVATTAYADAIAALKANLASPTFTGTPAAPTAAYGTNTTQLATTAMVQAAIATSVDDGNSSTADTIDFSAGNVHKSTLTGTCVYTFTAPPTGQVVVLKVIQGSGPYTVTWPGTVKWPAATAPTLTTTNGHMDVFTFLWDGTDYFGVVSGQDYTP